MSNFCPNCSSQTRTNRLLCDKCQEAFDKGERRGRVEELKNILKLDIDEREFEGFKVIEYCRERLLELEKGELK
jgi:uncharacterized membrane protein YvbJ